MQPLPLLLLVIRLPVCFFDKPVKTGAWTRIYIESMSHSRGCMAMQPREIYQAQNARFSGEFTAGFTGLTPLSR